MAFLVLLSAAVLWLNDRFGSIRFTPAIPDTEGEWPADQHLHSLPVGGADEYFTVDEAEEYQRKKE